MANANHQPTMSVRLRPEIREKLDEAAKKTRRSRSFLMQEALVRHLDEIVLQESANTGTARPRRYSKLLSLSGAGSLKRAPRSREEIDAHIRWLRDNG